MPITRTSKGKGPPKEFYDIKEELETYKIMMKDAMSANADDHNKRGSELGDKSSAKSRIFQIAHQRSRHVYSLYYDKEAISKELYNWLLNNGYADKMLIAKWKKQGYEQLCCTQCIQTKETNFNSTCICRVPKSSLKKDEDIACVSCGCKGCASSD